MVIGNVYDIQRFAVHDGPGIRTNVFLKGCPLRCIWCHSPESQNFENELFFSKGKCIGIEECGKCIKECDKQALSKKFKKEDACKEVCTVSIDWKKCQKCFKCVAVCPTEALNKVSKKLTIEDCINIISKDAKYYEESGGGVTISGGEPMSQFEFVKALVKECKLYGYHVALDTTGYAPLEKYMEILPYVDLFLYDLKCMDDKMHQKLTGVSNELILKNAIMLAEAGARFQIRIPIITGYNDSYKNIEETVLFCGKIVNVAPQKGKAIDRVQLLPYHSLGESKYEKIGRDYICDIDMPQSNLLNIFSTYFKEKRLKVVIG